MHDVMREYFSGEKLYGDDFSPEQLQRWYEDEKEGYSGKVVSRDEAYRYKYHELNNYYGFRHITLKQGSLALGLGSAYGHEFLPILPQLGHITIIDPSDEFTPTRDLKQVPITRRQPNIDGSMEFEDNSLDLITCFGVLHHIANVSKVLSECHRCLGPGGIMLCREPIVTQGDWRQTRRGITKNERGIPYDLFLKIVDNSGFDPERVSLFDFSPFVRIMNALGISVFSSKIATRCDRILASAFSFNKKYHRVKLIDKMGPASLFLVLRKLS